MNGRNADRNGAFKELPEGVVNKLSVIVRRRLYVETHHAVIEKEYRDTLIEYFSVRQ